MDLVKNLLMMLGGLGIFLTGLKLMGDNLQRLSGSKLQKTFNKISNNALSGVAVGAGVTALIQSSSATTVMVVGFVNAGIMTLQQAASIIMGANIGTTITAQIVALQSLPVTEIFAAFACIGAFMMMSKHDRINSLGSIFCGFGAIFVGLFVMSYSMKFLANNESVRNLMLATTNPVVLILIGVALTALIQSSSATTGILLTFCSVGLIAFKPAIFVTLGINIGTCITALLASIGANTNAKRAACIHLLFNFLGCLIFLILVLCLPIDKWFEKMFTNIETQIAMFHTFFNLSTTLILLPFIKVLTKAAILIIPDKPAKLNEDGYVELQPKFIDDRLLATPPIAIAQLRKEILFMASLAKKNFDTAIYAITHNNLDKQDKFARREKHINFLNAILTKYIVEISNLEISYADEKEIGSYYHVLSDIERVGDYCENIYEFTEKLIKAESVFSEDALKEIEQAVTAFNNLYELVYSSFERKDISNAKEVEDYEDLIDTYTNNMAANHVVRLNNNQCSVYAGSQYLSLSSNIERIGDHIFNVYKSMFSYVKLPTKVTVKKSEDKPHKDEKPHKTEHSDIK